MVRHDSTCNADKCGFCGYCGVNFYAHDRHLIVAHAANSKWARKLVKAAPLLSLELLEAANKQMEEHIVRGMKEPAFICAKAYKQARPALKRSLREARIRAALACQTEDTDVTSRVLNSQGGQAHVG